MMESNIVTTENKKYYASLAVLREVHSKLLKSYRKNSQSLELLEEIKDFIEQGRATGTILKNEDDRWDAQSRLDYWATILNSAGQELPNSTLAEFNSLTKLEQSIENIARKEYTEADILLVRQLITENEDDKLIQIGKYNVNIGEGKDIHIGDRIYQGAEAEFKGESSEAGLLLGQKLDEFSFEAPSLLAVLAPNLEGHLEKILMEWIETGDIKKLKATAKIFRKFNAGEKFYELSREIILRTQDEEILSYIESAIHTTPGLITGHMSNFYKQRLEEVSPWLEDDKFQVRNFAKKIISHLQEDIERQVATEELERRSWGQ